MILLRLISWPYVRRHLAADVADDAGIVLGVARVRRHVHGQPGGARTRSSARWTASPGRPQLQVTAGDSGFPEEVLERVQALPEVRVAVPVIEAASTPGLPGQGNLLVLAVDMTGDRSLRDYDLESGDEAVIDDPLVFLAQPDSLIVTREFAARNGLQSNSRITLRHDARRRTFTVRGIMTPAAWRSAFGGNLAIMDVYAAQKVFGRGRMFDRIDLALAEGVTLDAGRAAIEARSVRASTVEPPSSRGQQFESILRLYSMTMSISSLFALFIGMFIIYNSFAIAVTQRRTEIGILRALGATRRQIRTLFLVESAVAGLVGSTIGRRVRLPLARGIGRDLGQHAGGRLRPRPAAGGHRHARRCSAWRSASGVATSIVAAYIPARQAARVDPVQALQKGRYQVLSAGENRMRRRIALALAAVVRAVPAGRRPGRRVLHRVLPRHALAALLLTPTLALLAGRARCGRCCAGCGRSKGRSRPTA